MLIDSNFRDYYDSITSFGIDKTVVYQRRRTLLAPEEQSAIYAQLKLLTDFDFPQSGTQLSKSRDFEYRSIFFMIGFCGNLYKSVGLGNVYSEAESPKYTYFYDAKNLDSWLEKENFDNRDYLDWRSFRERRGRLNWEEYLIQTNGIDSKDCSL